MRILTAFALFFISFESHAGVDVSSSKVVYVYQQDLPPSEFEFRSDRPNNCGSTLYRVKSNNETIANRKFAIVLSALMSDKDLAFRDTQICDGSRSVVSWVRIIK